MFDRRLVRTGFALALALAAGQARAAPAPFPNIPYASWTDDEPQYRLYPGDDIDIAIPSAPELNKTVTVQPDGRITLPLIAPQMAANRTAPELERALTSAYASQLLRPRVTVSVHAQPLKVFVGGEVDKPGVYDMPGDIDALRAIIEAGGFRDTARKSIVVIIRRGRDGQAMMRTVDLDQAFKNPGQADLVPLRRFDIVYVPKTTLANIGVVVQQLRSTLPVDFSYAFGSTVF
jgi:polysaccharide export outer membrane protein